MSLFFYYGSSDLGNAAVRMGDGFRLVESAELGMVGMSSCAVDDLAGSLNLVGLHAFRVDETACAELRLFTGYWADRTLGRRASLRTGVSVVWDGTVTDQNACMQFEVIRDSTGNRPAETDIARITWLLGTAYVSPYMGSSQAFVDTSGAVMMSASDYRGRTPADVLTDCTTTSGKNHFVAWDQTRSIILLHYYAGTSSLFSSSQQISNVLADVDGSTTFAPDEAATLYRDPSSVYSGVYLQYGAGSVSQSVYQTDGTTQSALGHKREIAQQDSTVTDATHAANKAAAFLADSASEEDRITVVLNKVPAAKVNLIRAGQRVQVKFTHLPGYTAWTWIRVGRRTVQQQDQNQLLYRVTLELCNTKITRAKISHNPPKSQTSDSGTPDATVCDRAAAGIGGATAAALTSASGIDSFSYGGAAVYVSSKLSPNTAYTGCGCPIGCGGYGPGKFEQEAWYTIDMTNQTAADVGIMVTIGAAGSPQGAAAGFVIGVAHATPAGLGQWSAVGGVGLSGGLVFIPRSALGATNYLVMAPAWHSGGGFLCDYQLVSPCGGPLIGGEAGSGQATQGSITASFQSFCTGGWAPWVPGLETPDGSTTAFTLIGWAGHGTPQARVGPLVMAHQADYTFDSTTGVVTFKEAPPAYSQVAFRYMVAT